MTPNEALITAVMLLFLVGRHHSAVGQDTSSSFTDLDTTDATEDPGTLSDSVATSSTDAVTITATVSDAATAAASTTMVPISSSVFASTSIAAALSSISSTGAAPTVGPTTATANYGISLLLIWNGEDVGTEMIRQFFSQNLPAIVAACPTSRRINSTFFNLVTVSINTLTSLDDAINVQAQLSAANTLFTGLRMNALTPLFQYVDSATTVPNHPKMKFHVLGPIPMDLLQDALLKVIRQRIGESRYPTDTNNFRAAIIIDENFEITELTQLFEFFNKGLIFFSFSKSTIEESLLEVKNQGIINIIALVSAEVGDQLKLTAFQLNMLTYEYRWFFHGPRLINDNFDRRMETYSTNITSLEFGRVSDTLRKDLRTTSAVLVNDLQSNWNPYIKKYLCDEAGTVNTINLGFSGSFKLEPDGTVTRLTWTLEIYRGLEARKQHIGEWRSDGSFRMLPFPDPARTPQMALEELRLNTFRMVTIIIPPYVSYKPSVAADRPLKERLTGMYIELCKDILNALGITNYEFFLQEDEAFGVFNKSWNGIVKTMIDGKAHLGCAPVTIETSRKEVVAFSRVIHSSEQSILYKLPPGDAYTEMFQFLQPLDMYIWLTILGVLVFVAAVLAIMHAIIPNKGVKLTFYHSLYFSFAEVVQGTSGAVPNQLSGRIVVVFFWFFTLFLLLTYIANYAAFRILDGVTQQVDSLESLLQNNNFQFGVLNNTVSVTLLQSSSITYMQQIFLLLTDEFEDGIVHNSSVAVALMQNTSKRYALIADNLRNQYIADTHCSMMNTGQFYELKSAIVLPLNNEYGDYIDGEIAALSNKIVALRSSFFTVPSNETPDCTDRSFLGYVKLYTPKNIAETKEGALTLTNTLGIAMINLFGCIFALLLSGLERSFSRFLQKRSDARRRTQVAEAYEMSQRPTMLE